MVTIFLETAELRVKDRLDITLSFWKQNVNRMLEFNDRKILNHTGVVSNAQMEEKVRTIYEVFDEKRKAYEALEADKQDAETIEAIETIEKQVKNRKE